MVTDSSDQDRLPHPVPALVIDLDGTLLRSDLLLESALALLAGKPWLIFAFPSWLWRGKAHLKWQIASRVELDMSSMPWDERMLALVQDASGKREIVLCTASDEKLARAVAEHLGVFDFVLASDGQRNLSGRAKAEALVERYGHQGFDYAGNARVDLLVWASARQAIVVNASEGLAREALRRVDHDRLARACPDQQVHARVARVIEALVTVAFHKGLGLGAAGEIALPVAGEHQVEYAEVFGDGRSQFFVAGRA